MKKISIFLGVLVLFSVITFAYSFPKLTFYDKDYNTQAYLLSSGKYVNVFNEILGQIKENGKIIKKYPFQLVGFIKPALIENGPYNYYVYLYKNKVVDIYNNNLILNIKENGFVYDGQGNFLGSVTGKIKDNWQYIAVYYLFFSNKKIKTAVYKPYYVDDHSRNIILFFLNTY